MKTIDSLMVKVSYTVILSNVQVSDEVYEALGNCYDNGGEVSPDHADDMEQVAAEWLGDNIRESDAADWEYEIEDFEEE